MFLSIPFQRPNRTENKRTSICTRNTTVQCNFETSSRTDNSKSPYGNTLITYSGMSSRDIKQRHEQLYEQPPLIDNIMSLPTTSAYPPEYYAQSLLIRIIPAKCLFSFPTNKQCWHDPICCFVKCGSTNLVHVGVQYFNSMICFTLFDGLANIYNIETDENLVCANVFLLLSESRRWLRWFCCINKMKNTVLSEVRWEHSPVCKH